MTIWRSDPRLKNKIIRQAVCMYSRPRDAASKDAFALPAIDNTPPVPKIHIARKMKSTTNVKVSVKEKSRW